MITTLFKLFSKTKNSFENCKHKDAEKCSKQYFNELEKLKQSFNEEDKEKVEMLLLKHLDYLDCVNGIETDNYIILATKIGIELGRYFEVLENI